MHQPYMVMFVPRTANGALIAKLRAAESTMSQIMSYKVRLVEESGTQLKELLHNSNPHSKEDCTRYKCIPCIQKRGGNEEIGPCKARGILYTSTCQLCKARGTTSQYTGETSRSLAERSLEHVSDALYARGKKFFQNRFDKLRLPDLAAKFLYNCNNLSDSG